MRSGAPQRRAFTLVELLVVVAIIGVLAGLTIPAVLRVRDNANRLACKNNLKQIGIALANYESAIGRLPSGPSFRSPPGGELGVTWLTQLLPYLEATGSEQLGQIKPTPLHATVPALQSNGVTAGTVQGLLCPADGMGGAVSKAAGGAWSHSNYLAFVGLHSYGMEDQEGAFGTPHGRTMAEFQDGTSNTVVVGEYLTGVPHAEAPHDLRGVFWLDRPGSSQLYGSLPPNSLVADTLHIGNCYNAPERNLPCGVANEDDMLSATTRSRHRGGVNALQADGSVRFVANNIDRLTWRSLVTVASGSQEGSEVAGVGTVVAARTMPEGRPNQKVIFLRDRYTLQFEGAGAPAGLLAQLERQGLKVVHRFNTNKVKAINVRVPPELVAKVKNLPGLKAIRKDFLSFATGQVIPTGVSRIGAPESSAHAGQGHGPPINATIAIIDSGIDGGHPDLNVVRGAGFGYPTGQDGNGHGTHVAGTAAAIDNNIGVVGVAPGARLWAIRVLDQTGAGATSDIIAGLQFCINNFAEIDVVNMSIGGPDIDPVYRALAEELVARGVPIIAAAGNSSQDVSTEIFIINGQPRSVGSAPASFGGVVAVGAFADSDGKPGGLGPPLPLFNPFTGADTPDDTWAFFSNFGLKVAYVAPGVEILSTTPGNKYATLDGTSMASPHVAGLFALVIANDPLHNSGATLNNLGIDARIRNVHIGGEPKPRSNELKARIAANATETILGPADILELIGLSPYSINYPVANCRGF